MKRYNCFTSVLILLFASCHTNTAEPEGREEAKIATETESGDFRLRLVSGKEFYQEGENVQLAGKLKYFGEQEQVEIEYRSTPFKFKLYETVRGEEITPLENKEMQTNLITQGEWLEENYEKDIENTNDFTQEFLEAEGFPPGYYEISLQADFTYLIEEERHSMQIDTSLSISIED